MFDGRIAEDFKLFTGTGAASPASAPLHLAGGSTLSLVLVADAQSRPGMRRLVHPPAVEGA
ncbi:MAG TPA: hypothetical protein VM367_11310 [Pseudonocardia sp.]|jgi:hypothetical protein|nr:hypothetical protein [Pseudonocardia sp.]